jgi:hypothetical protein
MQQGMTRGEFCRDGEGMSAALLPRAVAARGALLLDNARPPLGVANDQGHVLLQSGHTLSQHDVCVGGVGGPLVGHGG